jgi:hypothetical protein
MAALKKFAASADSFDFHEQILAADVGLQVHDRSRGFQQLG